MSGVLEDIRVIEVAQYVLVPTAGAILAQLGMDWDRIGNLKSKGAIT